MKQHSKLLFAKLKKLAKLSKSPADQQEVLEQTDPNFLESAVSDIKRNWVDMSTLTRKHISRLIKGKHHVGKFTAAL